jgi:glycosyltransferase involved in cell wall biosynthesis
MVQKPPSAASPTDILLLVHCVGPGGTERQVAEVARSLDPACFIPHVGAVFPEGMRADELRAAGIPVIEIPVRSLTNGSTVKSFNILRRYIREHHIGIIHTFDAPTNVFAPPIARIMRVPAILTSQRCYRDLIGPKYHPLVRFSHSIANRVIANCEAMRAHLRSDYGVPDGKIDVVYNGLDTRIFHDRGRRRMRGLESASLVIGAVGVLREEKRLPLLLDAFAIVLPLDRAMKLVIVGNGAELPQLQKQAADLGIMDACLFQPASSNVANWFRSIDIFVSAARSEAFSNSLLESLACGCCPVASRVGGNPEMVTAETGLLFEPEDVAGLAAHLETLIRNPNLRARFAFASAASVARFSIDIMARRMSKVYLQAVAPEG